MAAISSVGGCRLVVDIAMCDRPRLDRALGAALRVGGERRQVAFAEDPGGQVRGAAGRTARAQERPTVAERLEERGVPDTRRVPERDRQPALDPTNGRVTSWDPHADFEVRALAVSGSTVYAGGSFTSIGGQHRNRIAALDATSGLATSWNPRSNGSVLALRVSGSTVSTVASNVRCS